MNFQGNENETALHNYPEILSAEMIAKYLSIGYVKALNLIKYGGIPYIKIGNTYRVSKRQFECWIENPTPRNITFQ